MKPFGQEKTRFPWPEAGWCQSWISGRSSVPLRGDAKVKRKNREQDVVSDDRVHSYSFGPGAVVFFAGTGT